VWATAWWTERVRSLCGCLTAFNLRHYNSRRSSTLPAFKCSVRGSFPQKSRNPGSSSRESHDKPNMILRQCYYHQRWQSEQQLSVRSSRGNPSDNLPPDFVCVCIVFVELKSECGGERKGARPWGYTDDADVAVIV